MSEAKTETPKAEANPAKKDLIVVATLGFVNLVVVLGSAFLVFKNTLGYHPPSIREPAAVAERKKAQEANEKEGQATLFTMDPFTVNLAGSPRRVIRMQMTLEMLDEEGFEEVVRLGSNARDSVVRILNAKEFTEIETIQGKLFLKDQIALKLNSFLKNGVVKDIYFNDFVVQ